MDDPVRLTISIDGTEVVAERFAVEGQHNWRRFALTVPPGRHVVVARSSTGAALETRFRMPADGVRYAVVDYWNYRNRQGRHLTWRVQATPIAFD